MPSYVLISNRGEVAPEEILTLGLSTQERGARRIGQFATGSKYAVAQFLREGQPITYLTGTDKLTFSVDHRCLKGKMYGAIVCSVNGKKPEDTRTTTEFGAVNWKESHMKHREVIANGLDAVNGDPTGVIIRTGDRISHPDRRHNDWTTVAIPSNEEVLQFINELPLWFLHWSTVEDPYKKRVLSKQVPGSPPRIYVKGVFIRTLGTKPSIYDYNFADEIQLDEARLVSDYGCHAAVTKLLIESDKATLVPVLREFRRDEEARRAEAVWNDWEIGYWGKDNPALKEAWVEGMGQKWLPCDIIGLARGLRNELDRRGYQMVTTPNEWLKALHGVGISTPYTVVEADEHGRVYGPGHPLAIAKAQEWFDRLIRYGVFNPLQHSAPSKVETFSPFSDEDDRMGCCKLSDKSIAIREGNEEHDEVYVEELGHCATGLDDHDPLWGRFWSDNCTRLLLRLEKVEKELAELRKGKEG